MIRLWLGIIAFCETPTLWQKLTIYYSFLSCTVLVKNLELSSQKLLDRRQDFLRSMTIAKRIDRIGHLGIGRRIF
jgi:hypothetical protein